MLTWIYGIDWMSWAYKAYNDLTERTEYGLTVDGKFAHVAI